MTKYRIFSTHWVLFLTKKRMCPLSGGAFLFPDDIQTFQIYQQVLCVSQKFVKCLGFCVNLLVVLIQVAEDVFAQTQEVLGDAAYGIEVFD